MMKDCENRYKLCRKNAGLTQFCASEKLHISEHTLSDYETGKYRVPDDIVAAMAEEYNAPLLAWWHLKKYSVLGKFLPEIITPQTHGDMAFQLILAQDDLSPAVTSIKKIMADGQIEDHEREDFTASIQLLRQVNGKLVSVITYATQLEKDMEVI